MSAKQGTGYGSGWGGGVGWGGATSDAGPQIFETVPLSEAYSVWLPLKVVSAIPITPFLVQVEYSHNLDYGYAPVLTLANYVIPGLVVSNVLLGPTSKTVRLVTTEQAATTYTLTVNDAHSYAGDVLHPAYHSVNFAGFAIRPTFFATAQSRTKVELIFATAMLQNAAFEDAASYQIADLNGSTVTITSATASGPSPIKRVTLELGASLDPGGYYVATILSSSVQTATGLPIFPEDDVFQWAEMQAPLRVGPIEIPIDEFSGEVSSGLLGQSLGQVFFSPALDVAAADSVIQVDEVSVCTRAYDVYTIPSLPDPNPLSTYGSDAPYSTALNEDVLWAPAERLGLVRINPTDNREETMPAAADGPADAELVETVDANRAAFLNVPGYTLFPGNSFSTNSLVLDGATEYIAVGNVVALQFDRLNTFSLVIWFKTVAATTQTLLGKREDGGTNRGYQLLIDGGFLRALLVNTGGADEIDVVSDNTFDDGIWHQAVLTYSGSGAASGVTLYIDSLALSTTTNADTLTGTILDAVGFNLGARGTVSTDFFAGNLDDGAVYDKELSQAEVTTIYNLGDPPDLTSVGPTADLVGYWRMGEGATFPTIPDDSVNANDGTMTNMAASDIVGAASGVFITADNLTPIGAGPTANINLQP